MPRPGQDIEHAGEMDRDIFCAVCGYNLRRGAVVGRCPECGGQYDTRSVTRQGIFSPQDLGLPWGDFFVTLVSAGLGLALLYSAVVDHIAWCYVPAVPFLLFMLFFLRLTVLNVVKYFSYHGLRRRIERASSEDR